MIVILSREWKDEPEYIIRMHCVTEGEQGKGKGKGNCANWSVLYKFSPFSINCHSQVVCVSAFVSQLSTVKLGKPALEVSLKLGSTHRMVCH